MQNLQIQKTVQYLRQTYSTKPVLGELILTKLFKMMKKKYCEPLEVQHIGKVFKFEDAPFPEEEAKGSAEAKKEPAMGEEGEEMDEEAEEKPDPKIEAAKKRLTSAVLVKFSQTIVSLHLQTSQRPNEIQNVLRNFE